MKRAAVHHIHSDRIARALEKQAMVEAAAALAPAIAALSREHRVTPRTIARIAAVRAAEVSA